jgi:hypothetical protein
MDTNDETQEPLVRDEEGAAASEAGSIGGDPSPGHPDPARQPVEEAGGGEAEGFEQAERDLVENASHGDGGGNPEADAIDNEHAESQASTVEYGEPDQIDPTEVTSDPSQEDDPGEGTPIAPDR